MPSLDNKRILLGVTGGIAAYKTPELVRLLVKAGAEVRVVMTPSAKTFVTAETLSVVSGFPVNTDFFQSEEGGWNNHVHMGSDADLFLIAPVTANTMAAMVAGSADNLLLATYLSARCPVMLAPAMDLDMMEHESTLRNLKQLETDGCLILDPKVGELASGLVGKGRMPEPEEILQEVIAYFKPQMFLSGKKVLITAGPTYENIDPVRFIGNHSTGKMGYAIAVVCASHGASVNLISGPTHLKDPENVNTIRVTSADEMLKACLQFTDSDIFIMTAAVADYRPAETATQKIKKTGDSLNINLTQNPDILATLAANKQPGQWFTGFALETADEAENARKKLTGKNLDMVVLNSLNDEGAGFGTDTNKVQFFYSDGSSEDLPLMKKSELAEKIASSIATKMALKIN